MALSRRTGARFQASIWPGFVDAMTGLLLVLILDHPTRGIDVGAKEEVYELVRAMTAEGLAVILLGDTLDEVIGLSSRILVMKDGAVAATFDAPAKAKPSQVDLVEHMV